MASWRDEPQQYFWGPFTESGKRLHPRQVQPAVLTKAGARLLMVLSTIPSLRCQAGRAHLMGQSSCLSAPSSFPSDGCSSWTGWSHSGNVGPGQQLGSFLACWLSRNEVTMDSSLWEVSAGLPAHPTPAPSPAPKSISSSKMSLLSWPEHLGLPSQPHPLPRISAGEFRVGDSREASPP